MDQLLTFLPIIVLLLGAVFPVAIIMLWVYFRDKLREPPSVVLLTMLFGGLATIPIIIVEIPATLLLGIGLDAQINSLWQAIAISFLVAALVEESFKFGVLRFYSARHSAFDEPFDGIVYGIAASLGFAFVENVMYVFVSMHEGGFAGGFIVAVARSLFAVPMHASCGVIMGACIGLSKFGGGAKWTFLGIVLAIIIHGTYDSFLFSMEIPGLAGESLWQILLSASVVFTTLLSVGISALVISRFRRGQLPLQELSTATEAVSVHEIESSEVVKIKIPLLPLISMIIAICTAGIPAAGILIGLVASDAHGNLNERLEIIIVLGFLVSMVLNVALFAVSILSICLEPRWRAASIVSLIVAGVVFLMDFLLLVFVASY